jgi:type I restriction enzyme, S subunit
VITDLKPYPAYKDSGVDWLGEVPEGWEIRRQSNLMDLRISTVDKHQVDSERPIRLCNYVDVYRNDRIRAEMSFSRGTALDEEVKRFRLQTEDVLITKDSESWEDIASPALVEDGGEDLVCGYHLAILRARRGLSGAYLFWTSQSLPVAHQYHVSANGVTRFGLTQGAIKRIEVTVPPLMDQVAIVRFLDYVDSRIQRLIAAKEQLVELLEEEKRATIHHAVTRGLDPDAPLKPSGIDWLGDVPEHWEVVPLKTLTAAIVNGSTPSPSESSYYEGGSVPWFGPSSLASEDGLGPPSRFLSELAFVTGKARRVTAPALLVTVIGGTAGRMGLLTEDAATNQQITAFTLEDGAIEPEVLVMQLRFASGWLRDTASTATMPILDGALLKRLPVAVPTRSEQLSLARFVRAVHASAIHVVARMESQTNLLREYRTRLISDVVTGKLDVREAAASLPEDPDADDPALDEWLEEVAAR